MTEEQIKEQLSNRFIGILAANKGFAIDKPELDLGVDYLLKKTTTYTNPQGKTRFTYDSRYIDLQLKAADVEIVNGGVEAAFTRLLHAVRATSGDDRTKVKDHLLNLFALVDQSDPRLVAARKELASALF